MIVFKQHTSSSLDRFDSWDAHGRRERAASREWVPGPAVDGGTGRSVTDDAQLQDAAPSPSCEPDDDGGTEEEIAGYGHGV